MYKRTQCFLRTALAADIKGILLEYIFEWLIYNLMESQFLETYLWFYMYWRIHIINKNELNVQIDIINEHNMIIVLLTEGNAITPFCITNAFCCSAT